MSEPKLKILLVDDSKLYRAKIRKMLEEHSDLEVIGEASDGREAIDLAVKLQPDFIVIDVIMPVMDGIRAIREILARMAVPILVLTAAESANSDFKAFDALDAGALDVLPKPNAADPGAFERTCEELPMKIRSLSRIRLLPRAKVAPKKPSRPPPIFLIGSSTGGPQALNTIFKGLPPSFPSPVVVVQHISHGFLDGLVNWIGRECTLPVEIVDRVTQLEPGKIYFGPTQKHIVLRGNSLHLTDDAPVNGCKPAADVLFQSAAHYADRVIGIVLTGMGQDGLEGAKRLNAQGAKVLVQSPKTCTVSGMPDAVISAGQASQVLDLESLVLEMNRLALDH